MPWEIIFWDVGQGDATTIKLPDGSYILIDAGPSLKNGNPLLQWLNDMGKPHIRLVVITHSHADHFAGLIPICRDREIAISKIVLLKDAGWRKQEENNLALFDALQNRRIEETSFGKPRTEVRLIDKAETLYSDGRLRLRIAFPSDISNANELPRDVNKTSMIIFLERDCDDETSPMIIFGGDATLSAIESACHEMCPVVLTGPHHGNPQNMPGWKVPAYAKFFSSELRPQNVFISVGRRNQYKLPNTKYIRGAANAGVCVCCSQLSENCDSNRTTDVFQGSPLLGLRKPADSVQCRGSMRVFASSEGIWFDECQAEFLKAIASTLPDAKCKPCGHFRN